MKIINKNNIESIWWNFKFMGIKCIHIRPKGNFFIITKTKRKKKENKRKNFIEHLVLTIQSMEESRKHKITTAATLKSTHTQEPPP